MERAERCRLWRQKNLERLREYKRLYRERNPWDTERDKNKLIKSDKYTTYIRWNAVAKKVPPSDKVCQVCGVSRVEFHHFDYKLPYCGYFLCRSHHVSAHKDKQTLENIRFFDYSKLIIPRKPI